MVIRVFSSKSVVDGLGTVISLPLTESILFVDQYSVLDCSSSSSRYRKTEPGADFVSSGELCTTIALPPFSLRSNTNVPPMVFA
jgi:hypothetical protein